MRLTSHLERSGPPRFQFLHVFLPNNRVPRFLLGSSSSSGCAAEGSLVLLAERGIAFSCSHIFICVFAVLDLELAVLAVLAVLVLLFFFAVPASSLVAWQPDGPDE